MNFSQVTKFNIPDPAPIAGYTKLDYIQANGGQRLSTGFYPKPTTCIEIDHEFTSLTVQQRLFGVIGDLYYQVYINGAGRYAYAYQNDSGNWINTQQTVRTERHVLKLDGKNGKFQLDGIYSVNLSGSPTKTATNPLWLTGYDNAGTPTNLAAIKIYSCKIWDNGTLVRDYIPVKDSNNIAGLYDLVNEEFVHSGSVNEYIAGNELYTTEVIKLFDNNNNILWAKAAKVLSSITVVDATTSLNRGATYSFGGAVIANYNDGSHAYVTSASTFTGYNMSTAGTYTVTAHYTESGVTKTATYSLTVNKVWTQIWSGSKTGNSNTSVDIATFSGLSGTVTLRITHSMSASGGSHSQSTTYYNNNGSTTTSTKPSSPFQFNLATGSNRNYILGVRRWSGNYGKQNYVAWNASSKKFYITGGSGTSGEDGTKTSVTVTKIERYY